MKRLIAAPAIIGLLLLGCSAEKDATPSEPPGSSEADEPTIKGVLSLLGGADGEPTDCVGEDGFNDISPGAEVTVRDGEGVIVGTGELESAASEASIKQRFVAAGEGTESDVDELLGIGDGWFCPLFFDVEVAEADFYEIEIGSRDPVTVSHDDLEADDWYVSRTLDGL